MISIFYLICFFFSLLRESSFMSKEISLSSLFLEESLLAFSKSSTETTTSTFFLVGGLCSGVERSNKFSAIESYLSLLLNSSWVFLEGLGRPKSKLKSSISADSFLDEVCFLEEDLSITSTILSLVMTSGVLNSIS